MFESDTAYKQLSGRDHSHSIKHPLDVRDGEFSVDSNVEYNDDWYRDQLWSKTFSPRVRRDCNVFLTFFVVLSFLSYVFLFVAMAMNLFLTLFFAVYGEWTFSAKLKALVFAIADFWFGLKFVKVFMILFGDLWRYVSLGWGSRYDEHLSLFLYQMIDWRKRAKSKTFEGWWRESLVKDKPVKVGYWSITKGNFYRLLYCFIALILLPFVYTFWFAFNNSNEGANSFIGSIFITLLLCSVVFFTFAWLYDYFVIIYILAIKLKRDYLIHHRCSVYCFRVWMSWIFWDNLYVSKESRRWNNRWMKMLMLFIDLVLAPAFISLVFWWRGIPETAIVFCALLPIVQYTLNILQAFRDEIFELNVEDDTQSEFAECAEQQEYKNTRATYTRSQKCWINVKMFKHRWSIILVIIFSLMFVSLVELGGLVFTTASHSFPSVEGATYPICNVNFEFGEDVLGPMEMTLIAHLAYYEVDVLNQSLAYFLGIDNFEMLETNDPNFHHFRATHRTRKAYDKGTGNVTKHFIAIKGNPESLQNTLQGMVLWSEITSFQIVNSFLPFLRLWPREQTRSLVYWLSIIQGWISGRSRMHNFMDKLSAYVTSILPPWEVYVNDTASSSDEVVMIGHSVGGGIGSIVASLEYQQYLGEPVVPRAISFGVSTIGSGYTSQKFGFNWKAAAATETSIWGERDVLPLIDVHAGLHQAIPCKQNSFLECHSSVATLCQLYSECALPRWGMQLAQKANFLNCICCSGEGTDFCSYNVTGGGKWKRCTNQ